MQTTKGTRKNTKNVVSTATRYIGRLYEGCAVKTHRLLEGNAMTACGVVLPPGNVTKSTYWMVNEYEKVDCLLCIGAERAAARRETSASSRA